MINKPNHATMNNPFRILTSIMITFFIMNSLSATKLIEIRHVDNQYIMVYFKDGEVFYKDDGKGASAFDGHAYAPGDDSLHQYGENLNLDIISDITTWRIKSKTDGNYGGKGKYPEAVFRKSKVMNSNHDWDYEFDHWIFLKLPKPLKQGVSYQLEIARETNTDKTSASFTFDMYNVLSEAIHVNMIGYIPDAPVKSADLYLWMGDGGQRDYTDFLGKKVWLKDMVSGDLHDAGKVSFWKESAKEYRGWNMTGSDVWNIDFSSFSKPGRYKLVVEDVGCSQEFEISSNSYFEPYKYSVRGYYYMRIGEDQMDMVPVPRRPLFIPGEDPDEDFTIYLTSLHPFLPIWDSIPGDTWDEPHFKPGETSIFYENRLPGNPTNPRRIGGHSDALDWDRHLAHVSNIYDLLLPYYLSDGKLDDDNLEISESGNSIPDLIDEARNEVDLFLALRDGDAYCQGLTNPDGERKMMFQAGATTMAAWANAANCAMLADCLGIAGKDDLKKFYLGEALTAFEFASKQADLQLDNKQDIGDASMRGRDFRMMAAAFLYNLTGDRKWEDIVARETVVKEDGKIYIDNGRFWVQTWGTAAYIKSKQEIHYPELQKLMKTAVQYQAFDHNVQYMYERPSRKSNNSGNWRTPQNLQVVTMAHAFNTDPKEKSILEQCMLLEADWGLGRNPSNTVEMTGLGERHYVNCYTAGRNDGTPGLHPGHTPYNNLGSWGGTHKGSNPQWFYEKCYPEWKAGGWPEQETYFNCRYMWSNGEFTPRQTMRGKMALLGYLHAIYSE